MKKVAVIGAGQMGTGIAQTVAQRGIEVLLADVDIALAQKAKARIEKTLAKLVEREKIAATDAAAALSNITPIGDYAPMADAGIIIEAATEREEIKRAIFAKAGEVLAPDAILASNTSSIPITRMAAATKYPARFIGLHFFNPVPVMQLIEVIPGLATSADTLARTSSVIARVPSMTPSRSARSHASSLARARPPDSPAQKPRTMSWPSCGPSPITRATSSWADQPSYSGVSTGCTTLAVPSKARTSDHASNA